MNTMKKRVLASAVAAGLASAAHAVYVNPNGTGQALIYPYYTVQGGHNTYLSVVNTTTDVKVIKVRFREGKNSADVLDFNLYLSPNDVWTAAVVPSTRTAGAMLITGDASCTNPQIPVAGVDFRNYAYSGANEDGETTSIERTREGYVEMIEMATLANGTSQANAATHNAAGIPSCTGLRGRNLNTGSFANALRAPTGDLFGTGTLINVTNGQDSGYSAVALADFNPSQIYAEAAEAAPDLGSAQDRSTVISGDSSWSSTFVDGYDAVSSALMQAEVLNEFVLDTGTNSNTDWVLTFPTKRFYTSLDVVNAAIAPFSTEFGEGGACEPIAFTFYDREERTALAAEGDFSPLPPGARGSSVCWESTVLSIRNGVAHTDTGATSGVLKSVNSSSVEVRAGFQNGWARLAFTGENAESGLISVNTTRTLLDGSQQPSNGVGTFVGLPVVGFMVRTFNNGTLGNFQANYGAAFTHKYNQVISINNQ